MCNGWDVEKLCKWFQTKELLQHVERPLPEKYIFLTMYSLQQNDYKIHTEMAPLEVSNAGKNVDAQ